MLGDAARGTDDTDLFLVTLRNFDAVAAFSRGGDLLWTLSPTIGSSFAFEDDRAAFYAPHHVSQTAVGATTMRLLLIDDGTYSAGRNCTAFAGRSCFSRALELELDFGASPPVARRVWEFEAPFGGAWAREEGADALNLNGGAVADLPASDDGGARHRLVAFTNLNRTATLEDGEDAVVARLYEVDAAGAAVGAMELALMPKYGDAGHFRALPAASLYGERAACPLDL